MNDKPAVCVLLTTYNRADLTIRALNTIDDDALIIDYLVVDDDSTDGTRDAIREWNYGRRSEGSLHIIMGSGSLYWAGGMRKGMEYLLKADEKIYDYLVLINDDVRFYPEALSKMIERSKIKGDMPITGATKDHSGTVSYGGVMYDKKKAKPRQMDIAEANVCPVDTVNCNCFLLPWDIFKETGTFDKNYIHSLADHDYGFTLKDKGYKIWLSDFYVGECEDNSIEGTWRDTHLGRLERIKKKEAVKGQPARQWFYYLKKNFGLRQAVWHSITPYLRIVFRK